MKKKILAVLLSAAMVAAMAMGCSSGGGSSAKSDGESKGKAEDMTFVVVPKCVHAWFDEVNKGAQKEADLLSEQLGVDVKIDYRAPESAEVSAQNSTLEQAAATNPTAILLDPVDYDGSADIIKEIQDRDIPVILFDAPTPQGSGLTSVGNDFAEQATIAVEMLVEKMGTKGKVAVMQGAPTAPNHAERYQAHLDALAKYPDIEVIDGGIETYDVKTPGSDKEIQFLSGGNQQKVIIGRAMACKPKLLVFDEPTKGIDVGTKTEIYRLMKKLAEEEGIGIIMISSEMEEIKKCSNRVIAMYEGKIVLLFWP